jgi:hypothetical protein
MGNSGVFVGAVDELASVPVHAAALGVKLVAFFGFVFGRESIFAADLIVAVGEIALDRGRNTWLP